MERREKCAPSFHFYSPHPTCSHYCRSCLLFALLARETGSVLCRIARCFGDAITFLNGHYDVVNGELGQNATQNTPFMEVDTTPTQSQARPQNNHGAPPVASGEPFHGLVIHLHAGAIHCNGKWWCSSTVLDSILEDFCEMIMYLFQVLWRNTVHAELRKKSKDD